MAAEALADAPPEAPSAPKQSAKASKDAAKAAKDEKATKGKGKKGADATAVAADGPNIAAHPRAVRAVARAKSWGGLLGFVLGGYLSLPTNTLAGAALRALIAGVVCYVVVWAGAVFLWRRLVMLEIKGREQQLAAAVQAAQAARARRELPAAGERQGAGAAS
jgi:hypothetical protein